MIWGGPDNTICLNCFYCFSGQIVVFTANLNTYCLPILFLLDDSLIRTPCRVLVSLTHRKRCLIKEIINKIYHTMLQNDSFLYLPCTIKVVISYNYTVFNFSQQFKRLLHLWCSCGGTVEWFKVCSCNHKISTDRFSNQQASVHVCLIKRQFINQAIKFS